MRKTNKSVDYSKNNPKPFKTEKLWLAVPLATASILAGLTVTTPVNAATTNTAEPSVTEQDSTTAITESKTGTTNDSEPINDAIDPNTSTENDSDTSSKDVVAPEGDSETESVDNSKNSTGNTLNSNNNTGSESDTTAQPFLLPASNSTVTSTSSDAVTQNSSNADSTTPVSGVTTNQEAITNSDAPTAKAIDQVPTLSNFYVGVNGSYVPYNSMAMVKVLPYSSELWSNEIGNNLFGFYIVLPSSVDSTLDWMQTGANNYVTALNAQGFIHINTLTVSELANTATGRQVYYFRPDDASSILGSNPQKGFSSQLKMSVLIHTTNDSSIKNVTINAKDDNGNDTFGTSNLPTNDVLYAGVGDTTEYPHGSLYESMPSTTFGTDWPDANVVGIASNNGAKQLSFIDTKVTDNYYVRYTTAGSTTLSGLLYNATSAISPGTSYDPSTYEQGFLKTLTNNKKSWWLPSFRYVGTFPNISTLTYNAATQTLPTTVTAEPMSLDLNSTAATGNNYAFIVAKIATALDTNDSTIDEGTAWTPDDNITFTMPSAGESSTISHEKISDMTPENSVKNENGSTTYTYTDSDGTMTVISNVDTSTPGTYTVQYSYTDNQGNVTTPATASTITVTADDSVLKTIDPENIITSSDGIWTYAQGITELKDKNGNDITPATALADTTDPLTVTIKDASGNTLTNADGSNATSIDTSKPGTYTIDYTYGKLTKSTTLTIDDSILTTTDKTITAGTTWNPADNITTLTGSDGNPVDAATALKNSTLTATIPSTDGTTTVNADTINPAQSGKYTITYTYLDSVGKTLTKTAVLTINAKTSGSGSNSGSDSSNNSGSGNTTDPDNGSDSGSGNNTDTGNSGSSNNTGNGNSNSGSNTSTNNSSSSNSSSGDNTASNDTSVNNTDTSSNIVTEPNNGGNLITGAKTNSSGNLNIATDPNNLISNSTNVAKDTNSQETQANSGTLPQTSEKSASLFTQLGLFLLTITGILGFRRKKSQK
ncbi:beta strand repeat-containing protein [Companilactobacillus huachuanensis]|uniref:Beta strand repeat-containing protein n=1 Tax=Companilactobacillus huachuanensis TaxID=2559914 RepID=A0ABW1RMF1_9LACO|nr:bacterial Ig-like domain-containing protein [Companilactobacillus huachuanensis]